MEESCDALDEAFAEALERTGGRLRETAATDILIIGGGMIVHDQILPSLYHLQRLGRIGDIAVCARRAETLRALAEAPMWQRAFPGQSFHATLEPFAHAICAKWSPATSYSSPSPTSCTTKSIMAALSLRSARLHGEAAGARTSPRRRDRRSGAAAAACWSPSIITSASTTAA